MPGRDTAPGFLLRRLACAGIGRPLAKRTQVAKTQHRGGAAARSKSQRDPSAATRDGKRGVIAAEAARSAVLEPDLEAHCENH